MLPISELLSTYSLVSYYESSEIDYVMIRVHGLLQIWKEPLKSSLHVKRKKLISNNGKSVIEDSSITFK